MLGIFLDQETTGLDSKKHRVLELAFIVVDLSNGKELATYSAVINQSREVWDERDPASITINGFAWDEIVKGKSESIVSEETQQILKKVGFKRGEGVFICQNPSFDRPFFAQLIDPYTQERLFWPYHWLDLASMYWALEVMKAKATHLPIPNELALSKDSIAKALTLPAEGKPHRALQGVKHLFACYKKIVGFPEESR